MLANMLGAMPMQICANSRATWQGGELTFGQNTAGPGARQPAALALPAGTA